MSCPNCQALAKDNALLRKKLEWIEGYFQGPLIEPVFPEQNPIPLQWAEDIVHLKDRIWAREIQGNSTSDVSS